jgi:hypothetical protein
METHKHHKNPKGLLRYRDCLPHPTVKMETTDIINDETYPLSQVNSIYEPLISYKFKPCKSYTFIIADMHKINPKAPSTTSIYLHLLKVNNSVVVHPYVPLSPQSIGLHAYHVFVYEQCEDFNLHHVLRRENFQLDEFVEFNRLKKVAELVFYTSRLL